jgi:lipopolysaccharide/colanic/teichoic acid biosynthesis glycosyltransferase
MPRRVRTECSTRAVPLPLERPDQVYARLVKPAMDRVLALAAIVLFSPVLLTVALLIKLDDGGPIFFAQQRTGYLGRRFRLLKFRTMVANAEGLKASLMALNLHRDGTDFKLEEDPRVTRIGRFLRRSSLDELPNLFNILRGEMSCVGPRPTSFDGRTYRLPHLPRLAVRPGLTGLWQVSGRATIDFDRRCELDVDYIRRMSLGFDLWLMLRTIAVVVSRRGAF